MATKLSPADDMSKKLAALEKKLGKGILHKAATSVPVNRLPFMEPNLNRATWGGAPWGRTTALYGDESTGKSRIALELIKQAQDLPGSLEVAINPRIAYHIRQTDNTDLADKIRRNHQLLVKMLTDELAWTKLNFPNGADAVYYNVEQQFDKLYAKKIGIDNDRLMICDTTVIEEICEVLQNFFSDYPIHIVDSTSYASSNLLLKEEVGKQLRAPDARQWKVGLKQAKAFFTPMNMLILIHQMSVNQTTGGSQPLSSKFLKHESSLSIRFTKGSFLYYDQYGVLVDEKPAGAAEKALAGIEASGIQVFATVEKSRTCRPRLSAGLQWDFKKLSYNSIHEVASSGIHFGFIEKKGSWFAVPGEGKNIGQGLKTVYARLEDDIELFESIIARQMDYSDEL